VTKQANPRFSVHLSDSDSDPDAPLVRRAAAGDERAMRLLWERHRAHVDAVVRRLVDDADQAADVAQEVWVQIFRALPSWRGEARFGTWLHRVAVNRTLNAVRALRRVARRESPLDVERWDAEPAALAAAPIPDAERAVTADAIAAAARQLAPGARQVFYLHDVEGYTHEEIAASLGITAGGSKSQLFKARAKLRRLLAPHVDRAAAPAAPVSPPPAAPAAPAVLTLAHAAPGV
jgi:RNA polymerase sigma-70 factor (ECF subfamily)